MVDGITSEVGRALVGLAFLQLTIKSIAPDQNIRLHKGTTRRGSFSWVEGISMRTIDSKYITPFLRERLLVSFVHSTDYSARAFEITMHGLFQAMDELHFLGGADVVPLSQMRSANKKHGNVGDIELTENNVIFESWDAKYGKPYLRDELEELRDKLLTHPDCKIAGFVADSAVDLRRGITSRKNEIEAETSTEIYLLSFDQWVDHEVAPLTGEQKNTLGRRWLAAVVESFAQRRPQLAPIDEPCDAWLRDLIKIIGRGPA